ncbi:MAG: hypothetical protein JWP03_1021 [Phycisphaerales bacterium]|jgi:hypothetical protein|nr:hypothetical protein [Phycisphaerales bacterium]
MPQDVRLHGRVAVKCGLVGGEVLANRFDGVDDVAKEQRVRPHSSTASFRTFCPNRPWRAPSETTSTSTPSKSRKSINSPPWSKRERPGSKRTRRSRSEDSVASPRATDPKMRTSNAVSASDLQNRAALPLNELASEHYFDSIVVPPSTRKGKVRHECCR